MQWHAINVDRIRPAAQDHRRQGQGTDVESMSIERLLDRAGEQPDRDKRAALEAEGAEVILYVVERGGHTWPGRPIAGGILGPTTMNMKANDVIWEFFQKHPRE